MTTDALPARRGSPKARYGWTTTEGKQRELRADDDGLVQPKNADDERVLRDVFGLGAAQESGGSRSRKRSKAASEKGPASAAPERTAGDEAAPAKLPESTSGEEG